MSGLSVLPFLSYRQAPVFVDAGSAMTKVMWRGQVVFHEPSQIVIDQTNHDLIALGVAAANLSGKLTQGLELVPVMVSGQISQIEAFTLFARGILQKLAKSKWDNLLGLPVVYSQSSNSSEFNQKINHLAWSRAGWRVRSAVAKHSALHAALPRPFLCIVDHGSALTEVVVYSQSKLLLADTLGWGGNRYTQAILDQVRTNSGVVMSWAGAEQVKLKIGRCSVKDDTTEPVTKLSIRASQNSLNQNQTLVLHSGQFTSALNQQIDELCQRLAQSLAQLSSEALADLSQHGLVLCGGSAQLKGLAARLSASLALPVSLAQTPELCLVKGLAVGGKT